MWNGNIPPVDPDCVLPGRLSALFFRVFFTWQGQFAEPRE